MGERRFEWGGLSADRGDYVTAAEALAMLEVLVVAQADLAVTTELRDGAAWARFSRGERWAVVSTPGSRWFSVETDTGHRLQIVDANTSKDQSAQLLAVHVDVAEAYVRGEAVPVRAGGLGGSVLAIDVNGRQVLLTQSVGRRVRGLFGR
ncbi:MULTISPECIES: hypothetical protein [Microbacterium]|uniref:Uncharacterized protein n=1 Tax=Microbacterium testaceum TaxID=2033 RepID=A0A4Y3QHB5_MICTE|nr:MULTISPECIES: hypothetical protein [Microbacterium]MDZ5143307.1 hypothetical protein [Microbacterium testaceum]PNW07927.1 hypothetical protein C1632_14145 [Microbacterium testaceum]REC99392.1 hypothetical protein DEU35_0366 [Microbacterium sp. AG157]WJS91885.1 hypothetical protein NYQ11_04835 [Microbacterium testaceum]GEB44542.1 hypothetical protein MTE01_04870 [Microbacterium testaceum]